MRSIRWVARVRKCTAACLCGLLAALMLVRAGAAAGATLRRAVLVLPLPSSVRERPDDAWLGVAIQEMFDDALSLHSGLDECWLGWHQEEIFPTEADFLAYCARGRGLPSRMRAAAVRYVLTGTIATGPGGALAARVRLHDLSTGRAFDGVLPLDFPGFVHLRIRFIDLLKRAGLAPPAAQRSKMLWREALSREAMGALGRCYYRYLAAWYPGRPGAFAPGPYQRVAAMAPGSYLALDNLGWAQYQGKDYADGAASLCRALAINPWGVDAADGLIQCEVALGDESAALAATRAKTRAQGRDGRKELAHTYRKLGGRLYDASQYAAAERDYQRALGISRAIHDRAGEDIALNDLGMVCYNLRQYRRAADYLRQSHALAVAMPIRSVKDRKEDATTLDNLGLVYAALTQFDRAIGYYEQALAVWRGVGDRRAEAGTLRNQGNLYTTMDRYESAIECYRRALAIERAVGDRTGEGTTLSNLGFACQLLSRFPQSIEYYQQALTVVRSLQDRAGEGDVLSNLGAVYLDVSQYDRAMSCLQDALPLRRAAGDRAGEGATLNNLGDLYGALGQYSDALEYYKKALAITRAIGDRRHEGSVLNNLGWACNQLGQFRKGVEYYNQSLALAREMKNRGAEATLLSNLGDSCLNFQQYDQATAYLEQALALQRALKSRNGEGVTLGNLGCACLRPGHYDRALAYFAQSLAISRELGNRDSEELALANMMFACDAMHRPALAIFYGKLAVDALQEIRGHVRSLDKTLRASFIKSKADSYRELADLLIAQGRILEGEQVLGLLKESEFRKFTRAGPAGATVAFTPLEQKYHAAYQAIADRLVTLGAEYDGLQRLAARTPTQEKRLAELDATLQADRSELDRFMKQLGTELGSSPTAGRQEDAIRGASDVQETLKDLGPGVAVIYVLVLPDHVREVLVTSSIYKPYEVSIPQAELFHRVADFRRVLQNPGLDPRPAAQAMYGILLPAALRQDLAALHPTTVAWWLDGRLRYIPVNALYDGEKYLVERWNNTVFTEETARKLELPAVAKWRVAAMGVSKAWGDFSALPGVPQELQDVVHAPGDPADSGDLPGTRALDAQFTGDVLRAALLDRVPVVHIASHFAFRPGDDTRSFLLLGTGQRLTLEDIKTWRFSGVDLLTLSACDTASGTVDADGHELESFAMLAQRAGARAVIATLWPVADRSTPALMRAFYRLRAQHPGMSKIEALQQAQIGLLRGTLTVDEAPQAQRGMRGQELPVRDFVRDPKAPYAHPYFWAPFILMGDWK